MCSGASPGTDQAGRDGCFGKAETGFAGDIYGLSGDSQVLAFAGEQPFAARRLNYLTTDSNRGWKPRPNPYFQPHNGHPNSAKKGGER